MGNDSLKNRTFDAIVIGSGISGGWAAKELTEKGLKTLVLERGRDVRHIKDYPTTNKYPWEFEHRGTVPLGLKKDYSVSARCYIFNEDCKDFFVSDAEHPYIQDKPFDWIRGYQVGGKSLTWARHSLRWSDLDFEGPARDGFAVDWPIRYQDIAPWYSHVEKFIGVAGSKEGLPQLPDGEFLPPMEFSCVEQHFKDSIASHYTDRRLISARCAHLTQPQPIHLEQGRGQCLRRDLCQRGCPFGAYFSSNSSTLPWASKTGNLTLRPHSVVHSIIYDGQKGKATGVRVVDAQTKEMTEFYAKVIFVNASALNTNLILLNSTSQRFPEGLGNDNGLLGKYVLFHSFKARVQGRYEGFKEFTTEGRRPTTTYIPRFQNLYRQETDFLRGYAAGFYGVRPSTLPSEGFGTQLKQNLAQARLEPWFVEAYMMGEIIPRESNHVRLDSDQKDAWGIPLLRISVGYDDNDARMVKHFHQQFSEMFEKAGFSNITLANSEAAPGLDTHEMGGVRMGKDPKTSLLNRWNQLHACKNVFVTDGACMTSTATQNPSLTYMALTARAADYAVSALKKGEL